MELINILSLIRTDPLKAADKLDNLADRIKLISKTLRENNSPDKCKGGSTDRVQISVVGPDGQVKHSIDTGEV